MQKQRLFGVSVIIFVTVSIFAVGCSKTGPAGATGPTGPKGNANVQVDTFTLVSSQWLWNDNYILYTSSGSYTEWFTRYNKVTFPAVTQGVLDSGLVLVYMTPDLSAKSQWSPVPFTFDTGLGYSYDFVYVTSPGGVELEFYFAEQVSGVTPPTLSTFQMPSYSFKLVAVTGEIATSMENRHIKYSNYSEVANFLGL